MKHIFSILIISIFTIMACNPPKTDIDTLVVNGKIYTVDSSFSIAECMAINDGKILELGKEAEMLAKYNADTIIDCQRNFVYPGFNDAHCHLYSYGVNKELQADLKGTKSFEEIIEILIAFHKERNYEWIVGRGWDQNLWPVKEFPTKDTLDKLFPNNPVVLIRVDGHAVLANSEAMKRAGVTAETKMEGGEIFVSDGELTGILLDKAADHMKETVPLPNHEQKSNALIRAQNDCLAAGLTSITDAGLSKQNIIIIDSLQKKDELLIRINAMLDPTEENFEYFIPKGVLQTPKLSIRTIKVYADGALGSRGALLKQPYTDDSTNYGIMVESTEFYHRMCRLAVDNGFQMSTHAIGDSAVSMMLNIYKDYLVPGNDLRWRIEHSQIVDPADMPVFGQYAILPSVQATHATSDMFWADERLGAERTKNAYAYKQLLAQNGWLPNGTDFPIEEIYPLYTFYAAVARQDKDGMPANGFQIENALSRQEALRSVTLWPAKASFEENHKGSLEPGKYADFIILDKDIMQIDNSDILKTKLLYTFIDGKEVFKRFN